MIQFVGEENAPIGSHHDSSRLLDLSRYRWPAVAGKPALRCARERPDCPSFVNPPDRLMEGVRDDNPTITIERESSGTEQIQSCAQRRSTVATIEQRLAAGDRSQQSIFFHTKNAAPVADY
jgi:hypothetical protein